ncbi:C40 family peptidase, partial [Streptomyces klenkii]|uniref:C40 family peptidase n=1 Tax=Streptomyces klenkii TaxID=1420899 RepID=UPI001F5430EF
MSPIRYRAARGRHRKPRASRTTTLLRGGLLTGVVGTVAVTGATTPASAGEQPAERTGELPILDAEAAALAAAATETYVGETTARDDWQRAQDRALARAHEQAAERRAAAEEAAERRARQQAAAEAAAAEEAAAAAEQVQTLATATAEAPAPATGGSGSGSAIVDFVRAQLGDAYSMGSTGPGAWDCSGLVQAAYASVGIDLPRTSGEQSVRGTQVSLDALHP